MKRLAIVTDAWAPQTNGVVTTLKSVIRELPALGFEVSVIHPGQFRTVPLPGYPEIGVVRDPWRLQPLLDSLGPDDVHIATEGPLGVCARNLLCSRRVPFTTSLHTKFPEYLYERARVPLGWGYRFLRWFHRPALATLCTTTSHMAELDRWGFEHLVVWGRGVDLGTFSPDPARVGSGTPRLLYVGRIAVEKNLEAFLALDVPGEKVLVGDGPARAQLEARYPDAQWLGCLKGRRLVAEYQVADVLVFPSRTDTFGLVMLEAMACGTPVAAYPVTGPIDVVNTGRTGALSPDLAVAVRAALGICRQGCREHAESYGWRQVAERFAASFGPGSRLSRRLPSSDSGRTMIRDESHA